MFNSNAVLFMHKSINQSALYKVPFLQPPTHIFSLTNAHMPRHSVFLTVISSARHLKLMSYETYSDIQRANANSKHVKVERQTDITFACSKLRRE